MKTTKLLVQCVSMFGLMVLLSGCLVSAQGRHVGIVVAEDSAPQPTAQKTGPPAHAKAYGFRAQHRYYFYPDSSVYFDTGRSVYAVEDRTPRL
ncbi:MAG: hypothetical protein JXQ81_06300 [Desulfuromonadales bacterium]|nr:hypothetical protein [Desulfuromonadales bacterium]